MLIKEPMFKKFGQFNRLLILKVILLFLILNLVMMNLYPVRIISAQACPTSFGTNETIVLEAGLLTITNPLDATTFNLSSTDKCIIGNEASIPKPYEGYTNIKSKYYDNLRFDSSKVTKEPLITGNQSQNAPANPIQLNGSKDKIYNIQGNLDIDTNNMMVNKSGIIFVDGNLNINQNMPNTSATAGVVFVVAGNVNVKEAVTDVNAYIITFGRFCSGWLGAADVNCAGDLPPDNEPQLIFKGSVISLSEDPAKSPKFVRNNADPRGIPAELFQYQPKYLIIVRSIFSADRIIWSEIN